MNGVDLSDWRKRAGVSQGGLAKSAGVALKTVQRAEAARDTAIPAKLRAVVERAEAAAPAPPAAKAKPVKAVVIPPQLREAMKRNPPYATTMAEAKAMRELRAEQRGVPVAHIRLLPLQPVWRRLEGGRTVNAAIPEPIEAAAPTWAGPRGVLTASGAVYDYESAMPMHAANALNVAQAVAGDW